MEKRACHAALGQGVRQLETQQAAADDHGPARTSRGGLKPLGVVTASDSENSRHIRRPPLWNHGAAAGGEDKRVV